jgi:hypothetical protein
MRGAIPPLPSTPSLRGVQLKHRDSVTFNVKLSCVLNVLHLITDTAASLFLTAEMKFSKTKQWHSFVFYRGKKKNSISLGRHVRVNKTRRKC